MVPLLTFRSLYDLEHIVPLRSIQSIEGKTTMGVQSLVLTYADKDGRKHSLRIKPKNTQTFLHALETSSARTGTTIPAINVVPEEPIPPLDVALRKYWLNLLTVGLFPTVFFVLCGDFHLPFPVIIPFFFATMFYGAWPTITKRVPWPYQFVMGAVWLGGGILGGIVASFVSQLLKSSNP